MPDVRPELVLTDDPRSDRTRPARHRHGRVMCAPPDTGSIRCSAPGDSCPPRPRGALRPGAARSAWCASRRRHSKPTSGSTRSASPASPGRGSKMPWRARRPLPRPHRAPLPRFCRRVSASFAGQSDGAHARVRASWTPTVASRSPHRSRVGASCSAPPRWSAPNRRRGGAAKAAIFPGGAARLAKWMAKATTGRAPRCRNRRATHPSDRRHRTAARGCTWRPRVFGCRSRPFMSGRRTHSGRLHTSPLCAYLIRSSGEGSGAFLFDRPISEASRSSPGDGTEDEWIFLRRQSGSPARVRSASIACESSTRELGARLTGYRAWDSAPSVEESCSGIHLAREHSAADWSTRLRKADKVYAALDVELLPDVRDRIAELLDGARATQIARSRSSRHGAFAHPRRPSGKSRGVRGFTRCGRRATSPLPTQLWVGTATFAREIDTAPGRLVT